MGWIWISWDVPKSENFNPKNEQHVWSTYKELDFKTCPHHDSLCWSHSDFLLVLVSCNDQDTQALAKYRRRTTAVLLRQEIDQPKGRRCFQSQRSKSALQPTWNLRCSQNAMQRLKATIGRSALILCESRTNQTHPVHNQTTPNLSN